MAKKENLPEFKKKISRCMNLQSGINDLTKEIDESILGSKKNPDDKITEFEEELEKKEEDLSKNVIPEYKKIYECQIGNLKVKIKHLKEGGAAGKVLQETVDKYEEEIDNLKKENDDLKNKFSITEEPKDLKTLVETIFSMTKEVPEIQPKAFSDYYDLILQNENKFNEKTQSLVQNCQTAVEILTNDESKNGVKDSISKLLRNTHLISKYINDPPFKTDKFRPFDDFYQINEFAFQESFADELSFVQDFLVDFKEFDKKKLFQDFSEDEIEGLDKVNPINRPEGYKEIIKNDHLIREYELFVSVTTILLTLRDLKKLQEEHKTLDQEKKNKEDEFLNQLIEKADTINLLNLNNLTKVSGIDDKLNKEFSELKEKLTNEFDNLTNEFNKTKEEKQSLNKMICSTIRSFSLEQFEEEEECPEEDIDPNKINKNLNNAINKYKNYVTSLEEDLEKYKQKFEDEIKSHKKDNSDWQSRLEEKEKEMNDKTQQFNKLISEKNDEFTESKKVFQERIERIEKINKENNEEKDKLNKDLEKAKDENNELKEKNNKLSNNNEELKQNLQGFIDKEMELMDNFSMLPEKVDGIKANFSEQTQKRNELVNQFIKLINEVDSHCTESANLIKSDDGVIRSLLTYLDTIKFYESELQNEGEVRDKNSLIKNFYDNNKVTPEQLKQRVYPIVSSIPDEFKSDTNYKELFLGFFEINEDTKLDELKCAEHPDNYESLIKDENKLNDYRTFTSTFNLIASVSALNKFKDEYYKSIDVVSEEEKEITKKEIEEMSADVKSKVQDQIKKLAYVKYNQIKINQLEFNSYILERKSTEIQSNIKKTQDNFEKKFNEYIEILANERIKEQEIIKFIHKNDQPETPKRTEIPREPKQIDKSKPSQFSDLDKTQCNSKFDELVTKSRQDDNFDFKNLSIQDFCFLTKDIHNLNDEQIQFVIKFYLNKLKNKEEGLKDALNFDNFSEKIIQRVNQYDSLLESLGQMRLSNEKIIYDLDGEKGSSERFSEMKKSKTKYYDIYNCLNQEIKIIEGTEHIEEGLFHGIEVEKVVIPETVRDIQTNAFYQCEKLTTVILKGINLETIGPSAFSGCTRLIKIELPEKISVINEYTFKDCQSLKQVTFPPNLLEIKNGAFSGCRSLTKLILPKSVRTIESKAFKNCSSLETFIISGIMAFYPSKEKEPVELTESTTSEITIEDKCFKGCSKIENVRIINKCSEIKKCAFEQCTNIKEFVFKLTEDSSIEESAFKECKQLTSILFIVKENSSLVIGDSAFQSCEKLQKVTFDRPELIGEDKLEIKSNVFNGCSSLIEFDFPPNCKGEIGDNCFDSCTLLKKVSLPGKTIKIPKCMFNECRNLETVDFPDCLEIIGEKSFNNCGKLVMQLPPKLKNIGEAAFMKCTALNIEEFPPELEEIHKSAFEGCNGLLRLIFPITLKLVDKSAFKECAKLTSIEFKSKKGCAVKKHAFADCSELVEAINIKANKYSSESFFNCPKVKNT